VVAIAGEIAGTRIAETEGTAIVVIVTVIEGTEEIEVTAGTEAIEAIDTGTERIDTGTEKETGTIEEIIIEDEETTIATLTRMGENEDASRNRAARIPEIGRRERRCRKERKGEAALETVMAQIADTTIEAIANLVGRVARTLAIGLNERA